MRGGIEEPYIERSHRIDEGSRLSEIDALWSESHGAQDIRRLVHDLVFPSRYVDDVHERANRRRSTKALAGRIWNQLAVGVLGAVRRDQFAWHWEPAQECPVISLLPRRGSGAVESRRGHCADEARTAGVGLGRRTGVRCECPVLHSYETGRGERCERKPTRARRDGAGTGGRVWAAVRA